MRMMNLLRMNELQSSTTLCLMLNLAGKNQSTTRKRMSATFIGIIKEEGEEMNTAVAEKEHALYLPKQTERT